MYSLLKSYLTPDPSDKVRMKIKAFALPETSTSSHDLGNDTFVFKDNHIKLLKCLLRTEIYIAENIERLLRRVRVGGKISIADRKIYSRMY